MLSPCASHRQERGVFMISCAHCGIPFMPKRDTQRYCGASCRNAAGLAKLADMKAAGCDPAHGGKAAEARRQSLARRRANGELLGRQLHNARLAAQSVTAEATPIPAQSPAPIAEQRPVPAQAQPVLTPEERMNADSAAYGASGSRWEHIAEKLLTKEKHTLVLAGYGAGIRVERDALIVKDGCTYDPQAPKTHTLYRGLHDIRHITVMAASGNLSLQAIQWATQEHITISMLDRDGALLQSLTPESSANAALRRCQYQASMTGLDIIIAQHLLRYKIAGQRYTLECHPELPDEARAQGITSLADALTWLDIETPPAWLNTLEQLMVYEAKCARAYFGAWSGLRLRWRGADVKKVPAHWLHFQSRISPLTGASARHAADPVNAILNYAYACLESQCRLALNTIGFDISCGILHADKDGRDSLVYDVMEVARSAVDALVLDFLKGAKFRIGDITPVSDGSCRLHPQLARTIVASCRVGQSRIDEDVRWLAKMLLEEREQPAKLRPVRRNKRWRYA
jgi:CRISP-associated protein Cas1